MGKKLSSQNVIQWVGHQWTSSWTNLWKSMQLSLEIASGQATPHLRTWRVPRSTKSWRWFTDAASRHIRTRSTHIHCDGSTVTTTSTTHRLHLQWCSRRLPKQQHLHQEVDGPPGQHGDYSRPRQWEREGLAQKLLGTVMEEVLKDDDHDDRSRQVNWLGFHILKNPQEAGPFSVRRFIQRDLWISTTEPPFSLDIWKIMTFINTILINYIQIVYKKS